MLFLLFIHYSRATYVAHGEVMYSPFCCLLSAQWRLGASSLFASA